MAEELYCLPAAPATVERWLDELSQLMKRWLQHPAVQLVRFEQGKSRTPDARELVERGTYSLAGNRGVDVTMAQPMLELLAMPGMDEEPSLVYLRDHRSPWQACFSTAPGRTAADSLLVVCGAIALALATGGVLLNDQNPAPFDSGELSPPEIWIEYLTRTLGAGPAASLDELGDRYQI